MPLKRRTPTERRSGGASTVMHCCGDSRRSPSAFPRSPLYKALCGTSISQQRMRSAFTGGTIITMDPAHVNPEVLIVDGDRIAGVGQRALLDSVAEPVPAVVDLRGATLVPGFIDAHNHLSISALH